MWPIFIKCVYSIQPCKLDQSKSKLKLDLNEMFAVYTFRRLDFKITKDEGNFEHWRYSVVYRERLSHWPYWINVADADYEVKKLASNEYLVASTHRTCFLAGLYCCKYNLIKHRVIIIEFIFHPLHFPSHSIFNGRVYFHSKRI